ncbi:DUF3278 domain-containing protein [Loigolactobacillus coryniformis]|uniref:DUF3278 domain-containing protein n=1 Tax=Loigolactobacillus coryniformis TaxID=1610 RepID=A0A5B8TCU4_9LACO|nr:DUF3278 domain-containing protein [Loigolactobacillus coryniformis]QEA52563.1 DUF3278 domain-containing protein [Loigolactobacillus coryniformis]
MKKRETLGVKVIKHFYGISGPLDEYKRQEVNRIGNNAFIWLWWYSLLSGIIALLFSNKDSKLTLWIYLCSNLIINGFVITGYITLAGHRKHLAEHEITANRIKMIQHKTIRGAILVGISYAVTWHFLMSLFAWFTENTSFYAYITSWHNIETAFLSGIIFGGLMYLVQLARIKKIDE